MKRWRGFVESAAMLAVMAVLSVAAKDATERGAWMIGGLYWMLRFAEEAFG